MCGIAGVINLRGDRVVEETVKAMTVAIRHRGPDGEDYYKNGCIGLGHTRLAIMDLTENSKQPMLSENGRYVLVYNGELYNYRMLRNELKDLGYHFYSEGDTEVIFYSLIEWGEKVVERYNGMFTFAFWDNNNQELLIGRDRYGIKPLYWSIQDSQLAFASEIKAIVAHPVFQTQIDLEGLLEYFTFQNFFSDHTLFEDIKTFPAGHTMKISLVRPEPVWNKYWDFLFQEPERIEYEQEYAEELDHLFRQAVQRQLMGKVEIGSFLSGGVDSGAITAIAATDKNRFKTFTCGFDLSSASGLELYFDERTKAELISSRFNTEHYQIVLKAGDMQDCLPSVVWYLDEPRVGQSYPNYYAAKLASHFVKVVLAGTGGDELFAGYPWRYFTAVENHSFDDYIDKYYLFWQRLIPNKAIQKVFSPVWDKVKNVWTRDIFQNVFNGHHINLTRPEDYINQSLFFEAKTFLHGLLIVEDKLSMAHGLESRVPFLDNDLVDFAQRLPTRFKLKNLHSAIRLDENEPCNKVHKYFQQSRDGKLLLRKVMERYIHKKISNGFKQGFSGPDGSWFKGASIEYVRDTIFNPTAQMYDYLDYRTIKELVAEHLEGKINRRLLIWSLLSFEEWCKQFS